MRKLRNSMAFSSILAVTLIVFTLGVVSSYGETITVSIQAENNDAEEHVNTLDTMDLGSSDLELMSEGDDATDWQVVGVQYALGIPQGSTINSASITFTVDANGTENAEGDNNITIYAEAIDNSPEFADTAQNLSGRSRTTASVAWVLNEDPTNIAVGSTVATPDLASIIQEVVNREGWAADNMLSILFFPDEYLASPTGGTATVQEIEMEAGPGDDSATLTIDYTPPVVVSTIEQDGDAVAAHIGDADLTDGAFTLQHVLGAGAGEDRVVVILVQTETTGDGSDANIPITSVTYDGAAATEATAAYGNPGEQTYRQQTNIFYINDADLPAAAGTYDVTITYGEGTVGDATLAAVAFTGVSQSGPAAAGNDAAGLSAETTSSISMQAYVDGSIAVDVAGGGQQDTTLTVDSAQTELFNIPGASARGAGSTLAIATAGNVSMRYTVGGNMNRYAHSAVLFSPATSGTTVAGITSNISPQFVSVGDDVVLTAPEGSGYQWYQNNVLLEGQTEATLVLDDIQIIDGGTYKVSYTSDTGAATTPGFWLPVKEAGEVPVTGLVGLAALMGACAFAGASLSRRRK